MTTYPIPVTDRHDRAHTGAPPRRRAVARLFLGERTDARWLRPAFWALPVVTAVVYCWDLSASGYANTFYADPVQAGTKSREAFFFGSLDSSNFITVDKPPASLWVIVLSALLLGFPSFRLLLPGALLALAPVAPAWVNVRRTRVRTSPVTANVGALVDGFVLAATAA
ncbi:glycosyl transferase, partial [Pseudomonas oryzihabitans]